MGGPMARTSNGAHAVSSTQGAHIAVVQGHPFLCALWGMDSTRGEGLSLWCNSAQEGATWHLGS
eukprot:4876202-Karenia_brevis.AAC.1